MRDTVIFLLIVFGYIAVCLFLLASGGTATCLGAVGLLGFAALIVINTVMEWRN